MHCQGKTLFSELSTESLNTISQKQTTTVAMLLQWLACLNQWLWVYFPIMVNLKINLPGLLDQRSLTWVPGKLLRRLRWPA